MTWLAFSTLAFLYSIRPNLDNKPASQIIEEDWSCLHAGCGDGLERLSLEASEQMNASCVHP
jgi:hypothetical protein